MFFLNIFINKLIFLYHVLWASCKVHWFTLIRIFTWISTWILIILMRNILLDILENLIWASSVSGPFSSFTYSLLHILRYFLIASVKFATGYPLSWLISFFYNVPILNYLALIRDHYIIVLFLLYWLLKNARLLS